MSAVADLTFDLDQVRPLVEHARASKKWGKTYGDDGPARPALWLVKDEGIYLMSNGIPPKLADGTVAAPYQVGLVAYARGFDPTERDRMEVWDDAHEAVGGDDFADPLPIDWFETAIASGRATIVLRFTPTSVEVLV